MGFFDDVPVLAGAEDQAGAIATGAIDPFADTVNAFDGNSANDEDLGWAGYGRDVIFETGEDDAFRVTGFPKTVHDTIFEGTIFGGPQPGPYEDTVDVPGPGAWGDLDEGGANDPDDPRNADIPLLGEAYNWLLSDPKRIIYILVGLWLFANAGPWVEAASNSGGASG